MSFDGHAGFAVNILLALRNALAGNMLDIRLSPATARVMRFNFSAVEEICAYVVWLRLTRLAVLSSSFIKTTRSLISMT